MKRERCLLWEEPTAYNVSGMQTQSANIRTHWTSIRLGFMECKDGTKRWNG